MIKPPIERPRFSAEFIRDLSERVYRARIGDGGVRMQADDKDDGAKLRKRAEVLDPLSRLYLEALGLQPGKMK